jgi:hypothetical protein
MMFDWAQRGPVESHRFRSFYDAGKGSATPCALCARTIRHCYVLHDQRMKTFVIGSCCFPRYEGTKTLVQLQAAKVLQRVRAAEIVRDVRVYGTLAQVREQRQRWIAARREALRLVRQYRQAHGGGWLPKDLYDLLMEASCKPRQWKLRGSALRWYGSQAEKIIAQTKHVGSI